MKKHRFVRIPESKYCDGTNNNHVKGYAINRNRPKHHILEICDVDENMLKYKPLPSPTLKLETQTCKVSKSAPTPASTLKKMKIVPVILRPGDVIVIKNAWNWETKTMNWSSPYFVIEVYGFNHIKARNSHGVEQTFRFKQCKLLSRDVLKCKALPSPTLKLETQTCKVSKSAPTPASTLKNMKFVPVILRPGDVIVIKNAWNWETKTMNWSSPYVVIEVHGINHIKARNSDGVEQTFRFKQCRILSQLSDTCHCNSRDK